MHLDPHESWVLSNATHFVACVFRGRGRYQRIEAATLAEAKRAAAQLGATDRPIMVYAVRGTHQALVATIEPQKEPDAMPSKPKTKHAAKPASARKSARTGKPKKPAAARTLAAAPKPVRAGTSLAALVGFMIAGNKTFEQMAKALDLRVDQVQHRVRYVLRVGHGIGHKVGADGRVSAMLPKGYGAATVIRARV